MARVLLPPWSQVEIRSPVGVTASSSEMFAKRDVPSRRDVVVLGYTLLPSDDEEVRGRGAR